MPAPTLPRPHSAAHDKQPGIILTVGNKPHNHVIFHDLTLYGASITSILIAVIRAPCPCYFQRYYSLRGFSNEYTDSRCPSPTHVQMLEQAHWTGPVSRLSQDASFILYSLYRPCHRVGVVEVPQCGAYIAVIVYTRETGPAHGHFKPFNTAAGPISRVYIVS